MAGRKDEKKPWEDIEATIKKRKKDHRNLESVLNAMDSQLEYEVAKILKEGSEEDVPNYDQLNEDSPDYKPEKAKKVLETIDKVYSTDSELHPLKKIIDKAKLERNYFNEQLVKGIYHPLTDKLRKAVGRPDFAAIMKAIHNQQREHQKESIGKHAFADFDPEKHGDTAIDYILNEHKIDLGKEGVDKDLLKKESAKLIELAYAGQLNKEYIKQLGVPNKNLKYHAQHER